MMTHRTREYLMSASPSKSGCASSILGQIAGLILGMASLNAHGHLTADDEEFLRSSKACNLATGTTCIPAHDKTIPVPQATAPTGLGSAKFQNWAMIDEAYSALCPSGAEAADTCRSLMAAGKAIGRDAGPMTRGEAILGLLSKEYLQTCRPNAANVRCKELPALLIQQSRSILAEKMKDPDKNKPGQQSRSSDEYLECGKVLGHSKVVDMKTGAVEIHPIVIPCKPQVVDFPDVKN
jgi:hypothetical protein